MSSFNDGVELDSNGNINTHKLAKELRGALDHDVKYKQVDNMKKRAIRVAPSYDDFKAMVACAHLKTLNRKEIEDLKTSKRGWHKSKSIDNSNNAGILEKEILSMQKLANHDIDISNTKFVKPKNPMEFERDWRRLPKDMDSKVQYLLKVGSKRIKSLLEKDGNAEIFEQVLIVIIYASTITNEQQVLDENNNNVDITTKSIEELDISSVDISTVDKQQDNNNENTNNEKKDMNVTKWLISISCYTNFDLMMRFMPKEIINLIVNILTNNGSDNDDKVINSINNYSKYIK